MERKVLYEEIIDDVALEISLDSKWRKKIFGMSMDTILEISSNESLLIPEYVKEDVINNKLEFCVKKVDGSEIKFDEGLIAFKFWSKEYPDVVSYSGNNQNVK